MSTKSKITFALILLAGAGIGGCYIKNLIDTDAAAKKFNSEVENHYQALQFSKITDERDGHKYKTIRIGDQNWMAENLRFDIPKISFCYNNMPENCQAYGNLYPWEAARQVCPTGWHLSTDKDWNILEEFIKENFNGDASYAKELLLKMDAGNLTKSVCHSKFHIDGKTYNSNNNCVYTTYDYYGFGAELSGTATYDFGELKWTDRNEISFWTNAETDRDAAVSRKISGVSKSGYIQRNSNVSKESLLAVRCVKNDENEPAANRKKVNSSPNNTQKTSQNNAPDAESLSQKIYEEGKEVAKEAGKVVIRKTLEKVSDMAAQEIDDL